MSKDGAGDCSIWHSLNVFPAFVLPIKITFRQDNPHIFRYLNTGISVYKKEWRKFGTRVDTAGFLMQHFDHTNPI